MKLNLLTQMALRTVKHMWANSRNTLKPLKGCYCEPGGVQRAFRGLFGLMIESLECSTSKRDFSSFYPLTIFGHPRHLKVLFMNLHTQSSHLDHFGTLVHHHGGIYEDWKKKKSLFHIMYSFGELCAWEGPGRPFVHTQGDPDTPRKVPKYFFCLPTLSCSL